MSTTRFILLSSLLAGVLIVAGGGQTKGKIVNGRRNLRGNEKGEVVGGV